MVVWPVSRQLKQLLGQRVDAWPGVLQLAQWLRGAASSALDFRSLCARHGPHLPPGLALSAAWGGGV